MKVARTHISRIIADQALAEGMNKRLSREIAASLINERRTGQLESILRDIQADWAAAGRVEVIAASAYPLSEETRREIERQVRALYPRAKRIVINERRDPAVIGGVRLELPGQQLDLSVKAKLNKFKQLTTAGKD